MPAKNARNSDTYDREIVTTRVIDAPPSRVWQAFCDPKRLIRWWGPTGFTNTFHEFNFAPGGTWRFIMHGPDGTDYPNVVTFRKIEPNALIDFDHGDDKNPNQFHSTITLERKGNGTLLTLEAVFPNKAAREYVVEKHRAIEGGKQTLEKWAQFVETKEANVMAETTDAKIEPFIIQRTLDAPRDLVWAAFTDSTRMQHWWGPKGFKVFHSKMDLRPGGTYHYGMTGPDGTDVWGKFEYESIEPKTRLMFFNMFSDEHGGITRHPMAPEWPKRMHTTITFSEKSGKTTVTIEWLPVDASAAELETFEKGRESMKGGWTGTFEQLEAYLDGAKH